MSNIRILNLATHVAPIVKEGGKQNWVEYGDDNNYYQYLLDRYIGSATNNAIVNGVCELIYGKGLDAWDSSRKPDEYAKMMSLFKKNDMRKIVTDYKMLGQAAFQVIYSKDRKKVAEVYHMPIETLRAEKCNDDGEIEAYYYAKDWKAVKNKKEVPQRIPAFGFSNEAIEILYIKPYRAGYYYYAPPDYLGSLPYAELEEEIANYHINNIKNGLAPSMLINFNNGIPTEEDQVMMENQIMAKFAGTSNSGRFILAFNDNKETAATIDPVELSNASEQYQFLADESMRKLMVGHRVTSPMLLGIKDQSGLGNNADELKTASILFENTIINPIREVILDAIDTILAKNEISLKVYFKSLQPLEFKESGMPMNEEEQEETTGVKLSDVDLKKPCYDGYEMIGFKIKNGRKVPNCVPIEASEQQFDAVFMELQEYGEVVNEDEWELVDERAVDYEKEESLDEALKFASVIAGAPDAKSKSQDKGLFKVRYKYTGNPSPEREFCKKMMSASRVYRKEDILAASGKSVNPGWGKDGSDKYSIWLYKGGARCRHFWTRLTYFRKRNADGSFMPNDGLDNDKKVSVNEARSQGFTPPVNDKRVAQPPFDMDYSGYTKEYAEAHGIPKTPKHRK